MAVMGAQEIKFVSNIKYNFESWTSFYNATILGSTFKKLDWKASVDLISVTADRNDIKQKSL